jgi:3-carboxy-cis,cis-muconate cycloisomerase
MGDLFWPGDDRAGDHFTSASFLAAMVDVEAEWADVDLSEVDAERHLEWLANESELGGNPVIGLVELLREATGDASIHRGLTSQDVVDTALMRMAEAAVGDLLEDLAAVVDRLAELATQHRDTPMVARTLTQHAIPTTFGFRVAQWLTGVLDARDDVRRLAFPDQLGGAAGTRAAMVELGRAVDREPLPWHTTRATVTRIGDALAGCTDACARIANDVLVLGRPEIGELAEGSGGGSSTMPNKANPVLSVLVRRAALTTPQLAATLHLAAASQVDDRADGGWHAEWATLRDLVRRTLVAVSQTSDLLDGLEVHPERMAATLAAAGDDVLAEQRSMAAHAGHEPAPSYLGQAGAIVDAVVRRATTEENR